MKLVLFVIGVLISSQSFALSFDSDLATQAGLSKYKQQILSSAPTTCTQFDGHWKGTCTAAGVSTPAELYVGQKDCSFISFNGAVQAIGGSRTESHGIPLEGGDVFSTTTTNMSWDATHENLLAKIQSAVYQNGQGYVYADSFAEEISIKNSQLIAGLKSTVTGAVYVCNFDKQK